MTGMKPRNLRDLVLALGLLAVAALLPRCGAWSPESEPLSGPMDRTRTSQPGSHQPTVLGVAALGLAEEALDDLGLGHYEATGLPAPSRYYPEVDLRFDLVDKDKRRIVYAISGPSFELGGQEVVRVGDPVTKAFKALGPGQREGSSYWFDGGHTGLRLLVRGDTVAGCRLVYQEVMSSGPASPESLTFRPRHPPLTPRGPRG